jgi:hypothetical protein
VSIHDGAHSAVVQMRRSCGVESLSAILLASGTRAGVGAFGPASRGRSGGRRHGRRWAARQLCQTLPQQPAMPRVGIRSVRLRNGRRPPVTKTTSGRHNPSDSVIVEGCPPFCGWTGSPFGSIPRTIHRRMCTLCAAEGMVYLETEREPELRGRMSISDIRRAVGLVGTHYETLLLAWHDVNPKP